MPGRHCGDPPLEILDVVIEIEHREALFPGGFAEDPDPFLPRDIRQWLLRAADLSDPELPAGDDTPLPAVPAGDVPGLQPGFQVRFGERSRQKDAADTARLRISIHLRGTVCRTDGWA